MECPADTSNIRAGLADFKCSFSILEAKQELMVFPVLLLDWVSFTACQALLEPASSLGREQEVSGVSSFQSSLKKNLFLLTESGKQGTF